MVSKQQPTRKKSKPDHTQIYWLDAEVKAALDVFDPIADKHAIKKRDTILRVAYQLATQSPIDEAFTHGDTCNRSVWYTRYVGTGDKRHLKIGWGDLPEVKAALAVCVAKLVPYLAAQKVKEIEEYRQIKALGIAKNAADATKIVSELMHDKNTPPQIRLKAATDSYSWDAPQDAALIQTPAPAGNFETVVNVVNDDRRTAEILDILRESGALESVDDAPPDAVHTPRPHDQASGLSTANLP